MTSSHAWQLFLRTASGDELVVSRIMLFPEPEVQNVRSLKATAQEQLGGFSTGIGFLGSPTWVLGGIAALGALESVVSNSKVKKGLGLLKEAAEKEKQLATKGILFPIAPIVGIDSPRVAAWKATEVSEIQLDLQAMGFIERAKAIEQHGLSAKQARSGVATINAPIAYVHNDEEFVWLEVNRRIRAVRWNFIETYELFDSKEP